MIALAVDAIVLDIEGTTAPIAFVHDVLFPFAAARLEGTIAERGADPDVAAAVAALEAERAGDREVSAPDVVAYAHALMRIDRKSTGLKALQGLIWRDGYREGALRNAKGEAFTLEYLDGGGGDAFSEPGTCAGRGGRRFEAARARSGGGRYG